VIGLTQYAANETGYESEVDAALKTWRQGDVIIGEGPGFLYISDLSKPLSPPARKEADSGFDEGENLTSIDALVPGFVVVSQTCDLLKACLEWPYVQLAALQEVPDVFEKQVRKGMRPAFASVPALANRRLVANLDLIMTVEKSVLAGFSRIQGVRNDTEAREFAQSLSRRFARFAFPEDFVTAVGPIRKRMIEKHGRKTVEGQAYEQIKEIRIVATPAWDAHEPAITFLFIRDDESPVSASLDGAIGSLMAKFVATGPFKDPDHRIVTLAEMTAALYVASDPLDLDYLSNSTNRTDASEA
jgi:hypothetical protein